MWGFDDSGEQPHGAAADDEEEDDKVAEERAAARRLAASTAFGWKDVRRRLSKVTTAAGTVDINQLGSFHSKSSLVTKKNGIWVNNFKGWSAKDATLIAYEPGKGVTEMYGGSGDVKKVAASVNKYGNSKSKELKFYVKCDYCAAK